MKIAKCEIYKHNRKLLKKTNTINEISNFIENDGSEYEVINIDSFDYKNCMDIRINFENGLTLFITIEK